MVRKEDQRRKYPDMSLLALIMGAPVVRIHTFLQVHSSRSGLFCFVFTDVGSVG
jgi:hypothetical protein